MMAGAQAQTKSRRCRRTTSFQPRLILDLVDPKIDQVYRCLDGMMGRQGLHKSRCGCNRQVSASVNEANLREIFEAPSRNKIVRIAEVTLFLLRAWRGRAGCILRDCRQAYLPLYSAAQEQDGNKGATTLDAARREKERKDEGVRVGGVREEGGRLGRLD